MSKLYQHGTLELIMAGLYDGTTTIKDVLEHGHTGVGTMDKLDGEVTVLDGNVYQTTSDGQTKKIVDLSLETPFISVHFDSENQVQIEQTDWTLKKMSASLSAIKNVPASIKIHGTFQTLKVRVAPKQSKPYPDFVTVSETQPIYDYKNITGTLVGDYGPDLYTGIMANGWHLHFVSDDFNIGGHVLDFEASDMDGVIDIFNQLNIVLPLSLIHISEPTRH